MCKDSYRCKALKLFICVSKYSPLWLWWGCNWGLCPRQASALLLSYTIIPKHNPISCLNTGSKWNIKAILKYVTWQSWWNKASHDWWSHISILETGVLGSSSSFPCFHCLTPLVYHLTCLCLYLLIYKIGIILWTIPGLNHEI
jgi:hypothetical protein